ncbi:guanylate kinase [Anaerobacillus isosaccharinicus]|uniref:Guanylate kinase n=1 Tax=Anaerobacillus isosaccharinicus TaxID=1532552 RepID=A0A1S2MD50_9BACI|nr:guanylate kinase [Anaerobacillus isosaccharinicus]MBA5585922.1 guanylate kinase [Anaerobacillus isosaccharinicus]QOY35790.1 guanylate kinase [Anaerobacillus isosaccharinicus]
MYNLKEKEMIFVFTGPDGSGRKTISKLVGDTLQMKSVISYTTRERRHYEVEGIDYHYITREQFLEAEKNEEFFESVEIDGNFYGIKEQEIVDRFESKGCIYLVLNIEGTEQLKEKFGDKVIRVFVHVDRETAVQRQKERGNSEEEIELHLNHFDQDLLYKEQCETAVENYELAHTVFEVTQTIEKYLLEKTK